MSYYSDESATTSEEEYSSDEEASSEEEITPVVRRTQAISVRTVPITGQYIQPSQYLPPTQYIQPAQYPQPIQVTQAPQPAPIVVRPSSQTVQGAPQSIRVIQQPTQVSGQISVVSAPQVPIQVPVTQPQIFQVPVATQTSQQSIQPIQVTQPIQPPQVFQVPQQITQISQQPIQVSQAAQPAPANIQVTLPQETIAQLLHKLPGINLTPTSFDPNQSVDINAILVHNPQIESTAEYTAREQLTLRLLQSELQLNNLTAVVVGYMMMAKLKLNVKYSSDVEQILEQMNKVLTQATVQSG